MFPAWAESLLVTDDSQDVVTSILYSTNSAVAERDWTPVELAAAAQFGFRQNRFLF
jgi:hypothetical protein